MADVSCPATRRVMSSSLRARRSIPCPLSSSDCSRLSSKHCTCTDKYRDKQSTAHCQGAARWKRCPLQAGARGTWSVVLHCHLTMPPRAYLVKRLISLEVVLSIKVFDFNLPSPASLASSNGFMTSLHQLKPSSSYKGRPERYASDK